MHSVKPNKFKLLLSLVALLLIFMVGVGVTYSWIEGGTTYSIQTEHEDDVKTGAHDSSFENTTIRLSTSATDTSIFQFNVFDNITKDYQDLIYTPVSSADGENFFLPVYDASGAQIGYRPATTNDIGNKYIQYETKFQAEDKCYLSFNGITGLTFGTNKSNTDPSAFRMMLSDGDDTYIFAYNQTSATSKPVTSVTGITPTTTTVTTNDYNNHAHDTTDTSKRLFTFEEGETKTIKISVWLENTHVYSNGKTIADLYGNQSVNVRVPFIVDVPKIVFSLDAVTYDEDGNPFTNGFTGGTIKYGSSTYSTKASNLSFVEGEGFTATANKKDGYEFLGWYSDAACNTQVTSSTTLSRNPDTSGKTYYALFQKLGIQTTTIYVEPRSGFSSYNVYAYNDDSGSTIYYSGEWPGAAGALDSATGYYKYTFDTSDTGHFYTIISNAGNNQYPGQNVQGLRGDIGGTYLFTADNQLIPFDPATMFTFKVQPSSTSAGTVYINSSGTTSLKLRPSQSVTISATPKSGYEFVGWYTSTTYANLISTSPTYTVTPTGSAGSTVTYYAKFNQVSTTDYYIDSSAVSWYGNSNAVLAYSTDGGTTKKNATQVTYCGASYWKVSVPTGTSSFLIYRYAPDAPETEVYFNQMSVTVSSGNNLFILNSGYTGGCWVKYTVGSRIVFVNTSAVSWFGNDNCVLAYRPSGTSTFTDCNSVTYGGIKYWYFCLDSSVTKFYIVRSNINGTYNQITVEFNSSMTTDLYTTNSSHNGGSWGNFLH